MSLTVVPARSGTRLLVTNGDLPGIPPEARRPGVVAVDTHTIAAG